MSHVLYALLVGIDDYPPPSRKLRGCCNDVRAFATFLQSGLDSTARLELKTLVDSGATREVVISTFREHLGRARAGDTALFYFAGHGSQEPTPPLYAAGESDLRDETLVAYDSRQPGGWDIADKELAVLIAEVAARQPHVLVILDSCHSGTATRLDDGGGKRRTAADRRQRPVESFWFFRPRDVPLDLDVAGGWRILPAGRHVLLTACRDFELAREKVMSDGSRHGLFSYHLLATLRQVGRQVNYRELHKQVQMRVNNRNPNQTPQASGDLEERVLSGGLLDGTPRFHVRNRRALGWQLDAGALHGIQPGSLLQVMSARTTTSPSAAEWLARVRVVSVEAAESKVEVVAGELPIEEVALPAELAEVPLEPLGVAFEDPVSVPPDLRQELAQSAWLNLCQRPAADFVVRRSARAWAICRPAAAEATPVVDGMSDGLTEALEHIARWHTAVTLENLASPLVQGIEMAALEWLGPPERAGGDPVVMARSLPSEPLQLRYRQRRDRSQPGRFTVRLTHRGPRPLYFALFGLGENFSVSLLRAAQGRLAPGHVYWVRPVDGIPASVPDGLHRRGVTKRHDVLLLLVSEVDADWSRLEQAALRTSGARQLARYRGEAPKGILDALLDRVAWRELDESSNSVVRHEWAAIRQSVVARRPVAALELNGAPGWQSWIGGIEVAAPDRLQASLRLRGASDVVDDAAAPSFPRLWQGKIELRPMALAGRLASDSGLSVLEIRGRGFSAVTRETPLGLRSETPLASHRALLVLAWNGCRYLLVGAVDGATHVACRIHELPGEYHGDKERVVLFFCTVPHEVYVSEGIGRLLGQVLGETAVR